MSSETTTKFRRWEVVEQVPSLQVGSTHEPTTPIGSRERLGRLLEDAVHQVGGDRNQLGHSPLLGELLLSLYRDDPERAWREHIQPFTEQKTELLKTIYEEHSRLRMSRCLDDYEGIALIERLHFDPDRVRDEWPLEFGELETIADAAGVRIAAL